MKRGKAKLLSEADIKNCLRYIDAMPNGERNRAMFEMMLNTALRIHSIQKLTIGQVYDDDFKPRDSFLLQPEQNKGHKKALQVYINDALSKELKRYAKHLTSLHPSVIPDDYLFRSNKGGGFLSKQQIIYTFRQIFDGVGLDKQYRCHSLRATTLTKLMDAGYPLPLIKEISGHSSVSTLSGYYRSNPKNIIQALQSIGQK